MRKAATVCVDKRKPSVVDFGSLPNMQKPYVAASCHRPAHCNSRHEKAGGRYAAGFPVQLPALGRFHRYDFVETLRIARIVQVSHRVGRQSAQLGMRLLDKIVSTIETKN